MDVQNRTNVMIFKGALILTIAGIITKILSAFYRVPFQNIVGDIGFYIYQQVYPFYGIAIILSTTGFPVMISKILAEFSDEDDHSNEWKILSMIFLFMLFFGVIFFIFLFFGSNVLANYMGDKQLVLLLKVISFSFLTLPFVSILRGYYQGKNIMEPTAISQVIEQTIRVIMILLISYLFIENGYDLYVTGAGAIFASLLGSISAFFVLFAFWKKTFPQFPIHKADLPFKKSKPLFIRLFVYSLTICFTSMLLILIQMVDSFNLLSLLQENGMGEKEAKIVKGVYDRGQPLLQLGTIVATSFALTLVPTISRDGKNNPQYVREKVELTFKVCFVLGAAATFGMFAIMESLNMMLFQDNKGTNVLAIYCLSILFSSIAITTAAILQAIDKSHLPAISVLVGIGVKWILNISLVPFYATSGAAISTVIAYIVIAILNMYFIQKHSFYFQENRSTFKIMIISFLMLGCVKICLNLFSLLIPVESRLTASIETFTAVFFGAWVYIMLILKWDVFHQEELSSFSFTRWRRRKFFKKVL